MKTILPLLVISLLCPLGEAQETPRDIPPFIAPRVITRPVQAYPFVHLDGCTGVCEFVVIKGKSIPIIFSADSDAVAVQLLRSLKAEIFLPNSNMPSSKLYVVGQFFDGVSRLAQGPGRPTDPGYHEFRLTRWYLATPFMEDDSYRDELCCGLSDQKILPKTRTKLRQSDFADIDGLKIDFNELHRRGN